MALLEHQIFREILTSAVKLFVHLRNMPAVWNNAYWNADAQVLSIESLSTAGTVAFVV